MGVSFSYCHSSNNSCRRASFASYSDCKCPGITGRSGVLKSRAVVNDFIPWQKASGTSSCWPTGKSPISFTKSARQGASPGKATKCGLESQGLSGRDLPRHLFPLHPRSSSTLGVRRSMVVPGSSHPSVGPVLAVVAVARHFVQTSDRPLREHTTGRKPERVLSNAVSGRFWILFFCDGHGLFRVLLAD